MHQWLSTIVTMTLAVGLLAVVVLYMYVNHDMPTEVTRGASALINGARLPM